MDSGFDKPLRVAARKHDLISVLLSDPLEWDIPAVGLLELEDAETGERLLLDTNQEASLRDYRQRVRGYGSRLKTKLSSMGIDTIDVRTDVPYVLPLLRFFEMRSRRIRR